MGPTSPLNYSESIPPGACSSLVFLGGSGVEEVWGSADSLPTIIIILYCLFVRNPCFHLSSVSVFLYQQYFVFVYSTPRGWSREGGGGNGTWNLK